MNKITAEHLQRNACVYVRQSTPDQLVHNLESQRRQYGLADRAKQLGWATVDIIDEDLGRSGGGIARPGFERLLAAICEGRVGAVFAIEASRLARNGRDWHTLIEFCGLVGTIIVDEDGIYDPRHPNDRLLLGMKGTMSELELSMFRQRSQEALRQKARRGALVLGVASGYVKAGRDRIEKNPDNRVQQAIQLVFTKFAEFQSARQVHIWLRDEGIELPAKSQPGDYLFTSRNGKGQRLSTRQYARLVSNWVALAGLNANSYGTHSLRRTKATLIYRKTGNLRAVQLLLGHTKIESTVRYLGVEVDDALAIAEQVDI